MGLDFKVTDFVNQNKNIAGTVTPQHLMLTKKDVFFNESIKKDNAFLYVGRANDPIKRIGLLKEALLKTINGVNEIIICGSENPGFGNYLNVVTDEKLNELYNSSNLFSELVIKLR